jgi:hypothetical protein
LSNQFGGTKIFKDVDNLEPGDDFVATIITAVSSCDVLLAMIGPRWASLTDAHGQRRIDNSSDFVRLEVETALARQVRVIPLLVNDAAMPAPEDLPSGLAPLARKHAVELSPGYFKRDAEELIKFLQDVFQEESSKIDRPNLTRAEVDQMPSPSALTGTAEPKVSPDLATRYRESPSSLSSLSSGAQKTTAAPLRKGFGRLLQVRWLIMAAVVLVLLIAGVVFTMQRSASQSAAVKPPAADNPTPSKVRRQLPQSAEPLSDDVFLLRRDDHGSRKVELVALDGRVIRILSDDEDNKAALLTPDRKSVLYLRRLDSGYSVHAMSVDGKEDRVLFRYRSKSCPILNRPVMRADGLLIVPCQLFKHGPTILNVMTLEGRRVRILDRGRLGDASLTHDGRSVIYWRADAKDNNAAGGVLVSARVDGSGRPRPITSAAEGVYSDPVCSPTDDVVVARRLSGGQRGIVSLKLTNRSSTHARQLTHASFDQGLSWSPDGSQILFRRQWVSGSDINLLTIGGAIRLILHSPGYSANPVWTAR